jgi:hypothetical protein
MRRSKRSYLKGATLRRCTYFLYLQCSSHFRMRLFSANSTSCCKIFNPNEGKVRMYLIYSSCKKSNCPLVGAAHEEFALAHHQIDREI